MRTKLVFLALLMASFSRFSLADTLHLTFSATAVDGFQTAGTLTAVSDPTRTGVYDVTGITGTAEGSAITGLLQGNAAYTQAFSPDGRFSFDNALFTSGLPFSNDGLLFSLANGDEINLFSDHGEMQYLSLQHAYPAEVPLDMSLSVAQTPEPSSLMLLGTGITGVATLVRRRVPRA